MRDKWMISLTGLLLCTMLVCGTAGCGSKDDNKKTFSGSPGVEDVLEAGMKEDDGASEETDTTDDINETDGTGQHQSGVSEDAPLPEVNADSGTALSNTGGIDVDLTALSSTVVYSEVYNMMNTPADYLGKTVKMTGTFQSFKDENTGSMYHTCIIKDATACCTQGMEFVLKDGDEYPEEESEITVVGVFDTYQEYGYTYCTLKDASLL